MSTLDIIEVDDWDDTDPLYNLTITNIDAETACRMKKLIIKHLSEIEFVTGTLAMDKDGKVWI